MTHYSFVFKKNYKCVHTSTPELSNGVGGELPLDTLIKLKRTLNISVDIIAYPERNITASKDRELFRLIQRLNYRDKDIIRGATQKMLDSE